MKRNCEIFVSIASYRDPELINTINDLYKNAKDPKNIRVVVFNQTDFVETEDYNVYFDNREVEIYSFDYRHTRGVSWVRHKIQSFIQNEKYYLQIDSHMQFGKDWDEKFIFYLNKCNTIKPVLTFYPSAYSLEGGKIQNDIIKNEIRGFNRKALSSQGIGMGKEICNLENGDNLPIIGTTTAAGFLFAPIEYVKEVPYDGNLFWNYEETDQTLRGYTNGWDFFGMPECLIWHKYNHTGKLRHYSEVEGSGERENKSNDHAEKKYFDKNFKTDYPLGNVRSLSEFEIINNLNFETGIIEKPESKDILIVVPYRDREEHLKTFLELTPKYFNERNITYDILICELDDVGDWNAGLPCNSVINFRKKGTYKYIYIHHVDVYPISGEWKFPQANELFFNLGDYGSCLMNHNDFYKIGGYRNSFWGWGAEDNDLNMKAHSHGMRVIDVKDITGYNVLFDEKYQNHERKFVGLNYSNSLQILKTKSDRNSDSVFDTNHHGTTHSLVKIGENVYKQNIKPLKKAPNKTKNKNLVISYIKDVSKETIYPFIKSVTYFAPYNYDIVVIDASKNDNQYIVSELESFGIKVINRNIMKFENLFLDRLVSYTEYIEENPYEKILCVDFNDVYFQGNPFDVIDLLPMDKIIITSEGITIKDQQWNSNMVKGLYGEDYLNGIGMYEVLNGGVLCGTIKTLNNFTNVILKEYHSLNDNCKEMYGVDQAIILKLVYGTQEIKTLTLREDNPLAIHLHTILMDSEDKGRFRNIEIIRNKIVRNSDNELFKIVHQYNRSNEMFNEVLRYFNTYHEPMS